MHVSVHHEFLQLDTIAVSSEVILLPDYRAIEHSDNYNFW